MALAAEQKAAVAAANRREQAMYERRKGEIQDSIEQARTAIPVRHLRPAAPAVASLAPPWHLLWTASAPRSPSLEAAPARCGTASSCRDRIPVGVLTSVVYIDMPWWWSSSVKK